MFLVRDEPGPVCVFTESQHFRGRVRVFSRMSRALIRQRLLNTRTNTARQFRTGVSAQLNTYSAGRR